MSMVSCLPKPSGMAILGDRQISYEDVELEWIGECDSKVERYCSSLLGSSKIGKIVIDIHESQAGLPNQGMDESYVLRLDEKIGIEAKTHKVKPKKCQSRIPANHNIIAPRSPNTPAVPKSG